MRQHSGVPLHLNLPTFADWLVSPQASRCFWSQSPQRSRASWVKWRQVYFWMASSHFLQGIYFLVCLITSNNKYISVSLRMWIAKWEQMFCDNSFLERKWQKYISCGAVGSGVGGGALVVVLNAWKSLCGSSGTLTVGFHNARHHSSFALIFWEDGVAAGSLGGTRVNKSKWKDKVLWWNINCIIRAKNMCEVCVRNWDETTTTGNTTRVRTSGRHVTVTESRSEILETRLWIHIVL